MVVDRRMYMAAVRNMLLVVVYGNSDDDDAVVIYGSGDVTTCEQDSKL